MKDIFDEYGDFILQAIGGLAALGLILSLVSKDGSINNVLANFMHNLT